MSKFLGVIFISILGSAAHAADSPEISSKPAKTPPTKLELLEQIESTQKAIDSLNQLQASVDAMTKQRKIKCLKAFGSETFCECLNMNLAVGLDFEGYVAVVTRTKEELQYGDLKKEDRDLVDNAIKTRAACIK